MNIGKYRVYPEGIQMRLKQQNSTYNRKSKFVKQNKILHDYASDL